MSKINIEFDAEEVRLIGLLWSIMEANPQRFESLIAFSSEGTEKLLDGLRKFWVAREVIKGL